MWWMKTATSIQSSKHPYCIGCGGRIGIVKKRYGGGGGRRQRRHIKELRLLLTWLNTVTLGRHTEPEVGCGARHDYREAVKDLGHVLYILLLLPPLRAIVSLLPRLPPLLHRFVAIVCFLPPLPLPQTSYLITPSLLTPTSVYPLMLFFFTANRRRRPIQMATQGPLQNHLFSLTLLERARLEGGRQPSAPLVSPWTAGCHFHFALHLRRWWIQSQPPTQQLGFEAERQRTGISGNSVRS